MTAYLDETTRRHIPDATASGIRSVVNTYQGVMLRTYPDQVPTENWRGGLRRRTQAGTASPPHGLLLSDLRFDLENNQFFIKAGAQLPAIEFETNTLYANEPGQLAGTEQAGSASVSVNEVAWVVPLVDYMHLADQTQMERPLPKGVLTGTVETQMQGTLQNQAGEFIGEVVGHWYASDAMVYDVNGVRFNPERFCAPKAPEDFRCINVGVFADLANPKQAELDAVVLFQFGYTVDYQALFAFGPVPPQDASPV